MSTVPRTLRGAVGTGVFAAGGAALSVWTWPVVAGVSVTAQEAGVVAAALGLVAVVVALSVWALRVRPVAAALLPVVILQVSYWLPVTGKLRPHVDHIAVYLLLACAIVAVLALRSRLHGVVTVLLALFGFGLFAAKHLGAVGAERPAIHQPPIVLLTLDTLRADHLVGFGGDVDTAHTPNLDAFFKTARVFRHAYAPIALTEPSHTTMLTGLGVEQHKVTVNGQNVPISLPWVPEELQAAGWYTRAVVSAAVLDGSLGLARGFDSYDSTFDHRYARAFAFLNWGGVLSHAGTAENRAGAATLALITSFPAGSFTWIHLYDAHWPYAPSAAAGAAIGLEDVTPLPETGIGRQMNPSDTKWPEAEVERGKLLYRASLQDLDALVRMVLERIPPEASVIIAGDHGESLDEHGYVFSHGRLPFAPDVHTVLAVRAPDLAPEWVDTPVSLQAIAPTLRALAGLDQPSGEVPSYRGLLGPIPSAPVLTVAYAEGFFGAQKEHPLGPIAGVAIRLPARTIAWTRWAEPAGYSPSADPRDRAPMPIEPDEQARLEGAAMSAGHSASPDPEMTSALEALGYLERTEPPDR